MRMLPTDSAGHRPCTMWTKSEPAYRGANRPRMRSPIHGLAMSGFSVFEAEKQATLMTV